MNSILLLITIIVTIYVSYIYICLSRDRNKAKETYININESLKEKWDVIPYFVDVIKEYSVFEEKTLEKLTSLINQDFEQFKMEQKLKVDNNISKVLLKIFKIVEKYPDLKEDENYINLSNYLLELENQIVDNKAEYSKSVKKYNTEIEVIPKNFVAILFGFNEEKFYQVGEKE